MLKGARVSAAMPTQDLNRARKFYSEKLGLEPVEESPGGVAYKMPDGTRFVLFPSSGKSSGTHTQMGFDVGDVDAEVKALKARGVRFEEYDTPGLKTVNSVAEMDGSKVAWFKDTEGNLIVIGTR